jgi:ABC-type transport system involved in cytochrome c biogenesis permease component
VLWLPLVFGAAAVASRGLASETDRGTMDLLRAIPVSAGSHGWSRTILHGAILTSLAALTIAAAVGLFGASPTWTTLAALGLGAVGLAVVATLASGLAAQARSRETLLPILLVPVSIPLLQAGLQATAAGLRGDPAQAATTSLLSMVAYDLLAIGVGWLLWDIILEAD